MSDDTDELASISAAATARQQAGGRAKDRLRSLKRTIQRKRVVALTYPAAGAVLSLAVAGLLFSLGDSVSGAVVLVVAAIYIVLYLWARKMPVYALGCTALVYVVHTAYSFIAEPDFATGTFGVLTGAGQTVWLIVSLTAAVQHRKLKRKLDAETAKTYDAMPA